MKKRILGIALAAMLSLGMLAIVGCSSNSGSSASSNSSAAASTTSGDISVYSREDGSGTRGAFIELLGIEQKDASGNKVDMTIASAAITNSTSVMMTSVAGDDQAIGYISLGSLNDTVKALKVDGAEATAANVKSGDYKVSRPFNIVTKAGLSEVAQDFINYIMSTEGQKVVEDNGYISLATDTKAYTSAGLSGKVVVAGSSSVTPVMEKLAEAYKALNPNVTIEVQQSDSTTGVNMATEGTCDIGMASRELKDSEKGSVTATVIAQDGIVIIVSPENTFSDVTAEQVQKIYTGEITKWDELA